MLFCPPKGLRLCPTPQFIDGLAGLWNVTAGHGRADLAEAMRDQSTTLAYVSGYSGSSNQPAIELAEQLSALCYPSINHFFFTSGGGEATESSIKMSRAYWKLKGKPDKTKVISRIDGYHGVTMAAIVQPVSASTGQCSSHVFRDSPTSLPLTRIDTPTRQT